MAGSNVSFNNAPSRCAQKSIAGVLILCGILFVLALAIDNREMVAVYFIIILRAIRALLSFGNHFWMAVAAGVAAAGVSNWAFCAGSQIPHALVMPHAKRRLRNIEGYAAILWLFEFVAALSIIFASLMEGEISSFEVMGLGAVLASKLCRPLFSFF